MIHIRTFEDIKEVISGQDPVPMTIVNPKGDYIFSALNEAESLGWIVPNILQFSNEYEAAKLGVQTIREGKSHLMMKGDIDTATLMRAVLNSKSGIRTDHRVSHIAVVESWYYPRLMILSDGGVNALQPPEVLESMIFNCVAMANKLGIDQPRVAMLSLVEKVTETVPETKVARDLVVKFKDHPGFIIEGPLALDVASSRKAALAKKIDSQIAGKTDIFIGPNITTINFMVKALMNLGGARAGGIISGAQVPIVLLSRSDSMETRLNSIALGLLALKGE